MSAIDQALKVLETPESEGGLADYEKILAVQVILRAAPLDLPAAVALVSAPVAAVEESVVSVPVEPAVVEAAASAVDPTPAQ